MCWFVWLTSQGVAVDLLEHIADLCEYIKKDDEFFVYVIMGRKDLEPHLKELGSVDHYRSAEQIIELVGKEK